MARLRGRMRDEGGGETADRVGSLSWVVGGEGESLVVT